jgi:hypothetical protein
MINVIIFTALILSAPVHAISRVGTCGIRDTIEGFAVEEVPSGFRDIHAIGSSGVQLAGVGAFPGGPFGPIERILIYPFRKEYPELMGLDPEAIRNYFLAASSRWSELPASNPCLWVMTATNGQARTTVVVWGRAKGIVLHSEFNAKTDLYREQLIEAIRLDDGLCVW